jgi:hypothetical protein
MSIPPFKIWWYEILKLQKLKYANLFQKMHYGNKIGNF